MEKPPVDNPLVSGFRSYLTGRVSHDTLRDYVNVVGKNKWPPVKRAHIRAWRSYIKYLFSIGRITWEQLQHYNLFLKMPSSKKAGEKRVEDSIISSYISRMRENGLTNIAVLLLGGARLKHVVLMFNNYKPGEIIKHPHGEFEPRLKCFSNFCRYYLGIKLGSKRCDYIYYPRLELEKQKLSYTKLKDTLNKHLGINTRLFRKYVNQRLEELAQKHMVRLDAVNLIISRELSVTGGHYLDTRNWADKLFSIYVGYLRQKGLI